MLEESSALTYVKMLLCKTLFKCELLYSFLIIITICAVLQIDEFYGIWIISQKSDFQKENFNIKLNFWSNIQGKEVFLLLIFHKQNL